MRARAIPRNAAIGIDNTAVLHVPSNHEATDFTGGTASVAARIASISPPGWVALAAFVVALMLALQTLHGRSVDYDEGVYWQSLRAMANGHPLFGSVFSSQPPLFLLSIYPFYIIFGQSLSAARLALIIFSLAGVSGTYVAGRALGHRTIGAVACLLLSLDPLYEHGAHTLQADLPSIALQVWAVACAALAMRATGRRRGWLTVGAGVLLGGALLTKLFAIAALVPIVLYLSAPFARRWLNDDGSLTQPPWMLIRDDLRQIVPTLGLLAAGLFGVIVLILLPFVGQLGTVYDQVVRFHLAAVQTMSRPLRDNLRLIDLMLLAGPLIYIAGLAVLVIAWRRIWVSVPLIFWAVAAFVTLAQQQPLWGHHIELLSPALALISGCGALAAWQAFTALGRQRAELAITLILLVLAGGAGLAINWPRNERANGPPTRELEMTFALRGVSAPDEVVLSDDQYVAALANRDLPPQLVDTSGVRIMSGFLTAAQLEDFISRNRIRVILFASGFFDLLPGFRAWVAQHYTQVATFDDGALFLMKPK
jgi:hypothetical protein